VSVVVVGTIGIDDIATPSGQVREVLGGSATYAAIASRLFAPTSLVSVVGEDFPPAHHETLLSRDINLDGLRVESGKTFRWGGRYHDDLNSRETVFVELNVVDNFEPRLPESAAAHRFIFLGNTAPTVQMGVLDQVCDECFVVTDSMDFWIEGQRRGVTDVFRRSSLVVLNDQEVRMFSGELSLTSAVAHIMHLGPRAVAVKRGEYGAALAASGAWFFAPGFPLSEVVDPTGAGDAFAGAMLGSIAEAGQPTDAALRRAIVYGSVVASYTVESFGIARLATLKRSEVDARYCMFRRLVEF